MQMIAYVNDHVQGFLLSKAFKSKGSLAKNHLMLKPLNRETFWTKNTWMYEHPMARTPKGSNSET